MSQNLPTVNVGATCITHRIEYKNSTERLNLISGICLAHPQGKKLVIVNSKGKILYEISAKQSVIRN